MKTKTFLWLFIGFIAIFAFSSIFKAPAPYPMPPQQAAAQYEQQKTDEEKRRLELEEEKKLVPKLEITYSKGGLAENILLLSGKIKNPPNGYNWIDPKINCGTFGNSGTPLGSVEKTIYQKLPIGGEIKLKEFSMGFIHSQTQMVSCSFVRH